MLDRRLVGDVDLHRRCVEGTCRFAAADIGAFLAVPEVLRLVGARQGGLVHHRHRFSRRVAHAHGGGCSGRALETVGHRDGDVLAVVGDLAVLQQRVHRTLGSGLLLI